MCKNGEGGVAIINTLQYIYYIERFLSVESNFAFALVLLYCAVIG